MALLSYKEALYRQRQRRRGERPPRFESESVEQELLWSYQKKYDNRAVDVVTPYGRLRYNDHRTWNRAIEKPHGNFRDDYPYHLSNQLGQGAGYVCGSVYDSLTPTFKMLAGCSCGQPAVVWCGGSVSVQPSYKALIASAKAALDEKIGKAFPSWDILTDIAELKETMGFFADGFKAIRNITVGCLTRNPKLVLSGFGVKATRRRRKHVTRVIDVYRSSLGASEAAVKSAADLWLAYRYGLMPLLYSCEDAINAIHTPFKSYGKTFQVTLKDRFVSVDSSTERMAAQGRLLWNVVAKTENQYSVRFRSFIDFSKNIMDRFIASPWAVPKAAWEAVPWSFVIDWFFDVGSYLSALDLQSVVGKVKTTMTTKDRCVARTSIQGVRTSNPRYTFSPEFTPGNACVTELFTFKRELSTIGASPPKLSWGLDKWKRQVDTFALIAQFARKPTTIGIP